VCIACMCRLSIFSNGTLVIRDVQESEAGWYRCVGSDANGQSSSFTSEVIIACKQLHLALIL
jgi:hypothetical protein